MSLFINTMFHFLKGVDCWHTNVIDSPFGYVNVMPAMITAAAEAYDVATSCIVDYSKTGQGFEGTAGNVSDRVCVVGHRTDSEQFKSYDVVHHELM